MALEPVDVVMKGFALYSSMSPLTKLPSINQLTRYLCSELKEV
jgi:hypothetical protein